MTTRRSFLKRQLILGGSIVLASSIDSAAKVAKSIYVKSNPNSLNLLCSSNIEHLGLYRQTINNFEMGSVNLFAGSVSQAKQLDNLLYDLSKANYHAVNFSWQNSQLNAEEIANLLYSSNSNFVNCNYAFDNKKLNAAISPYLIVYSGETKIGITGIGAKTNHKEISYKDPIKALNKVAKLLKTEQHCDKVICLADLGFNKNQELNNLILAQASANVDVIVGAGENPNGATAWSYRNTEKQEVFISANKSEQRYTNLLQLNTNNKQQFNFNTKNI